MAAETAADGLAGDGTDAQGVVGAAQTNHDTASGLVTALPDGTAKTALAARLSAVQATIDDEQAAADAVATATESVVVAETAAGALAGDGSDTQGAIDTARTNHDTASGLVTALPNSTAKTALESRLDDVQATMDDAQHALDTVIALQEAIDEASTLTESTYTASTWTVLQDALALPQTTLEEKATKAAALNDALDSLIVRIVTSIVVNLISGSNPYILNPSYPGELAHVTLQGVVRDQFGDVMALEGLSWSRDSISADDSVVDASLGGVRPNTVDFKFYNDRVSRTVTITASSVTDPNVQLNYIMVIR